MKPMSRFVLAVLVSAAVAAPAVAQNLAKERGNIVSANWQTMEVEIKDPQNRVGTWKVRRDATVTFTDKKSDFPNPKLTDLRAPITSTSPSTPTPRSSSSFEVREVGFEPSKGGPGVQQKRRDHQPRREHRPRRGEHGGRAEDLRGGPEGPAQQLQDRRQA